MITAGDFRNGMTFEEDGNVMQIIELQHVKPGKGAAFVRTKVKNVITGSVVEKTYSPSAKSLLSFFKSARAPSLKPYCVINPLALCHNSPSTVS